MANDIKPEEVIMDDEEEYDETPETKSGAEEIAITNPNQIPSKEEEVTYENEIADNPDVKNFLEYQRLKKKVLNGLPLTPEEREFKENIEELQRREAEVESAQARQEEEERIKQANKQATITKEYEDTKRLHPERIIVANEKDIVLHGGESFLKILKFSMAVKKAKKKGAKLLIQVFRGKKVVFSFTTKDLSFVEFYSYDEKGNVLQEITRITEYEYRLEGTAVPVLFAIQGFAEGFDFFKDFRKDLSSEMVSRLITRAFYAGYLKGAEVKQPNEKNKMLLELMPILVLVSLVLMGIVAYLCYSIYQDNTQILNTLAAIQQQASVVATQAATPIVVS